MSKPNYGRVTSGLLEAITELNRGGHSGGQNILRVARADELAAFHNASAMRDGAVAGRQRYYAPPSGRT